jgi:hypothetical protein
MLLTYDHYYHFHHRRPTTLIMEILVWCAALFAVCILGAHADSVLLTQADQIVQTVIAEIDCDQAAGAFIVTMYNGYLTPQTFYLSGLCDGIPTPLSPDASSYTIDARSNRTGILYGPPSASKNSNSIYGALCQINMAIAGTAQNGFLTTQIIRSSPAVCGPFQAGKCDCQGFWALDCYFNNCNGAESTLLWLLVSVGLVILSLLIFAFVHLKAKNVLLQQYAHYNAHLTRDRGTKLQKKVDAYAEKVRNGTMTKERLEDHLRTINSELTDPQYIELRRMEYVNPSGKKYTGEDTVDVPLLEENETAIEMTSMKYDDYTRNDRDMYGSGHVDVYARTNASKGGRSRGY